MTNNRLKYKDIAIKFFLFSKIYPDISLKLIIPLKEHQFVAQCVLSADGIKLIFA